MKKLATRNEAIVGALVAIFVLLGTAYAAIPSFRAASLRLTGASAAGTAGTAANPVVWADTTTRPNLRLGDGTADQYVPTCTPTTNGDVCSWNGTNWVRAAGGGGGVSWPITNSTSTDTFNYAGTMTGSSVAYSFDSTNAYGVGDKISFKSATVEVMKLSQQAGAGLWDFTSANTNIGIINSNGDGIRAQGANSVYVYGAGATQIQFLANNYMAPTGGMTSGDTTLPWPITYSKRYGTTSQSVSAATSTTVNPASGDHVRVLLSATAITTMTISPGQAGEEMRLEIIEDATGTRTIPTTWVNVSFAGGTYVVTTTASRRDVLTLVYDLTATRWYEASRSMNMTP